MNYKIRKSMRPCPNPFYFNVAWAHLPRPRLKINNKGMVDGYPIIHVDTGVAQ